MIILREKKEERKDPFNHPDICIFDPEFTFTSFYYWNNKYTLLTLNLIVTIKKLQYLRATTDNFLWNFVIKLYPRSKVLSTQNRIRVSIVYQLKLFVILWQPTDQWKSSYNHVLMNFTAKQVMMPFETWILCKKKLPVFKK